MQNMYGFPGHHDGVAVFLGTSSGWPNDWHVYEVPQGARFLHIVCVGGAGGGGGGRSDVAGTNRSGGGGGGAGAINAALYPAWALPRRLYVQPGKGGSGGAGGVAPTNNGSQGGNGAASYVGIVQNTTSGNNVVMTSGYGIGGGGGSTTASVGGGNGGNAWGGGTQGQSTIGIHDYNNGGSGSAGSNGSGPVLTPSGVPCGGAGGGGCQTTQANVGGRMDPPSGLNQWPSASLGGTPGVSDGSGGVLHWSDQWGFYPLGGAGGAGSDTGTATNGGKGSWGCGGGGGGGGAQGGNGGVGGPGFVIITAW